MATRAAVVAEAATWIGTPYHHQGRVKGVGVDCAMLLCDVYYTCGIIPYIDPRPYPMDWMEHRSNEVFLEWVEQYGTVTQAPAAGDVVMFRFGRCFSHGGIMLNDRELIHSYRKEHCVTRSDLSDARLAGRPVKFYSLWAN